jgi:hypothetical protein
LSHSIAVALPSRLSLPMLLSCWCCTIHRPLAPSPWSCCRTVALRSSPLLLLPLLLLLPPPPPPTFADPFVGWLFCRCIAVAPLRHRPCRCRCCHYPRHHHCPLLLIPLLVGCCVAVCAVDRLASGTIDLGQRNWYATVHLMHLSAYLPFPDMIRKTFGKSESSLCD